VTPSDTSEDHTQRTTVVVLTTLLPRLAGENVGLVTIYCDTGRGYLQFWRSVFQRRAPHSLARIEALGYEVRRGNTTRDPTDELLIVLTEAYQEATGTLPSQ
jgi:hypothetical protein